jgi:tRNA (guanine-N7-)-methyltransferase
LSTSSKKLSDNTPKRRVYGRRVGKPLKKHSIEALENILPALSVPASLLTEQGDLDPVSLLAFKKHCFEIGFGNGEHLNALMEKYPDVGFFGAEPFTNGMASFLKRIKDPKNIRVLMDDAMKLANSFKDSSLDKIYILNPDPWPKKRHHKRRIVSRENLDQFARILKTGGELIMATDVDELAEWMVSTTYAHPCFSWTARSPSDWKNPPIEWILTRYAEKGIAAGRKQTFLVFRKK